MNLGEIRESVKTYMALPQTPDALIDGWVRSGLRRLNSESTWPWQRAAITTDVPAAGDIDNGHDLARCRRIVNVHLLRNDSNTSQNSLSQIEISEALRRWPTVQYPASRPQVYTAIQSGTGQRIRLWPGDNDDKYSVYIDYYAWPPEWPIPGTPPPQQIPIDLAAHDAIWRWALSEALLREGQIAESGTMRALFHQQVQQLKSSFAMIPTGFRVGADNRIL